MMEKPILNKIIIHLNVFSKNLCEQLLIKGCDVNTRDEEGNTPLICTLKQKRIKAI